MRYRLVWPLAALSCAIVLTGLAFLWVWQGRSIGITVGLPVGATLIAPIFVWATGAQPAAGRSSPDQLRDAQQLLATRVYAQWRGLSGAVAPDREAWPPALSTLAARWSTVVLNQANPAQHRVVRTDGAVALADRLRRQPSARLVVLGDPGSGKSAFARSLMINLLNHATRDDPVPVFLPLAAWQPGSGRLSDWMAEQIASAAPELESDAQYGPSAISSLLSLGMVLPILDGLDTLSATSRRRLLESDDLLRQRQFVLTCRTSEYYPQAQRGGIPGAEVVVPARVGWPEVRQFLCRDAADYTRWEPVFSAVAHDSGGQLAQSLGEPRLIYLASAVYRDPRAEPAELLAPEVRGSSLSLEAHLLGKLIPAQLQAADDRPPSPPWYDERAVQWLRFLRDAARRGHSAPGEPVRIAWWTVLSATPRLYQHQALARAAAAGVIVLAAFLIDFHIRTFGVLTGLGYAITIFGACFFLAPVRPTPTPPFRRPVVVWLGHRFVARWWRVIAASLVALVGLGCLIGYRTALQYGYEDGIRTGRSDGLVAALTVLTGAVIAGLPVAPRSRQSGSHPEHATQEVAASGVPRASAFASIGAALLLGIVFGFVVGILTATKHQFRHGPSLGGALLFGVIMGINFAVGGWLVRWAQARLAPTAVASPLSVYRAERSFSLLAILILGATLASALGLDSKLQWDASGAITNGIVGLVAGSLASEWPLYIASITYLAVTRRLPFRLMKFLEVCSGQRVLRQVGDMYEFREDPALTLPSPLAQQTEHVLAHDPAPVAPIVAATSELPASAEVQTP